MPDLTAFLSVEGLSKSFFGVRVLHDVSFEAHAGEVLGLVGENGSGKSTAMNVLAGVLPRESGRILLDDVAYAPAGRRESEAAGVGFIQQELNIFPNLSVWENLFLGRFPKLSESLPLISAAKIRTRAREMLQAVELAVDPWAPASVLSAGERQLLEIARALSSNARVMIFDEPTSSLTAREAARLWDIIGRLKSRGVAVIYISHALEDVLRLSDRLVVMRDGRVTLKAANAGMTADDLVVAMVGRSIETLFPVRAAAIFEPRTVLDIDAVGESGVVRDITLRVNRGEILGLSGLMGAGRSELARIVFGLEEHSSGRVTVNGKTLPAGDVQTRLAAGVAYLTEDRRHEGLMMDASVADNIALAALPMFASGVERWINQARLNNAMQALLTQLNLKSGPMASTVVRTLSGGNQQKVMLGRWLLRSPELFILDEPTRGIDVGAKEEIYRLLARMADDGMAVLLISSEIEELIGLCDRILVMRGGRLQAQFVRKDFDREAILRAAFAPVQAT
jgi:ABC-type sugar transport system ATPase subunit